MIAVTLMGGLGNQMFQYAAGRSLALRHGTRLVLDLSFLRSLQPGVATAREYELGSFRIQASLADRIRSWEPPPPGVRTSGRLVWRARRALARFRVLRQKGLDFRSEFFSAPDDTHLIGFWQSEAYFREFADAIRDDFTLTAPPEGPNAEVLAEIAAGGAVSVHVRRGDYVADAPTGEFHGILGLDYYRQALGEIERRAGPARVFVFSDDPAWCREHLDLGRPARVVDNNAGRGWEDLRLMSACRQHVVANSSFSWWGAWLDARPDKIVVAPRRWVQDPTIDTSHVVPEGWTRL